MLFLMYASLTAKIDPRVAFLVSDLTHVPAYALLTFLLVKTLAMTPGHQDTRHQETTGDGCQVTGDKLHVTGVRCRVTFIAFTIAVSYGAIIEILQHFTGRQPSVLDVVLNAVGSGCVLVIIGLRRKYWIHKQ